MQKVFGSCLCNEVTFEVNGPFESFYLCHCRRCQKDTGSAHAANLFSQSATVTWSKGESHVRHFILPNTLHKKAFCKICGSALPNIQMDGRLLVVPAGSLDSPVSIKPDAHIFSGSRGNWDHSLEQVKVFKELP